MPSKMSSTDEFANIATISVVESSSNTLTFKKLETGISLNEKVAWLINRIEYFISNHYGVIMNAQSDEIHMGLVVSNVLSSYSAFASYSDPALVDRLDMERNDIGTAATGIFTEKPIVHDMSSLPGGGILVPPTPLYGYAQGVSLTEAISGIIKIYYTMLQLSVDQYWQLVEARRVISS